MKNLITDEGAASLAATYGPLASSSNALTRHEASVQLGLLAWRSGDAAAMRAHLGAAVQDGLDVAEALARTDAPSPSGSSVTQTQSGHTIRVQSLEPSLDAKLLVLLTVSVGDETQRARVARLPRRLYVDEANPGRTRALDELRAYAGGGALDAAAWSEIAQSRDADRSWPLLGQPFARAMSAIAEQNEILAGRTLDFLVQNHAWLAHEGEWARLTEGLVSFWGMALVRAAREQGVELSEPTDEHRAWYAPDLAIVRS